MQEQNFENQVRDKMEELSLTPSAPVWQNVEREIRTKKESRRMLLWVLPLLLLLGGFGWWFLEGNNKLNNTNLSDYTSGEKKQQSPLKTNTIPPAIAVPKKDEIKEQKKNNLADRPTEMATKKHVAFPQEKNKPPGKSNKAVVVKKGFNKNTTPVFNQVIDNRPKQKPSSGTDSIISTRPDSFAVVVQSAVIPVKNNNEATSEEPKEKITPVSIDSAQPKKITIATKKKWQFDAYVRGGLSDIQTIYLMQKRPDFYGSSLGTNGPSGLPPSPVEKGFAFSLGLNVKRRLTDRFWVSAGLRYSKFSTNSSIGQTVSRDTFILVPNSSTNSLINRYDSLYINRYYQTGNQHNQASKYYFIELPVNVMYQVFRKTPLYVHAGVSIAQMLSSNALLYNGTSNIYYKDKNAFNKTQVHLFTSIDYTIWKQKNFSLNAGPYLQYGLTSLEKKQTTPGNNLLSAGIKTTISF